MAPYQRVTTRYGRCTYSHLLLPLPLHSCRGAAHACLAAAASACFSLLPAAAAAVRHCWLLPALKPPLQMLLPSVAAAEAWCCLLPLLSLHAKAAHRQVRCTPAAGSITPARHSAVERSAGQRSGAEHLQILPQLLVGVH